MVFIDIYQLILLGVCYEQGPGKKNDRVLQKKKYQRSRSQSY